MIKFFKEAISGINIFHWSFVLIWTVMGAAFGHLLNKTNALAARVSILENQVNTEAAATRVRINAYTVELQRAGQR